MDEKFDSLESIKEWRENQLSLFQQDHGQLQKFHEAIFLSVYQLAVKEMMKEHGPPPCPFSWFVMGSAGRLEQGFMSDQDHGIIFQNNGEKEKSYFLILGKKIALALEYAGYPLCDGNVMSSNPLWCQSEEGWKRQIDSWIQENSWKSLRNLLIFMDARVVSGDSGRISTVKNTVFRIIREKPFLLERLLVNTRFHPKGIGVFNQLLPVNTGHYTGCINLKATAFFPYVNAIRLLAIIENIEETSTMGRMDALGKLELYHEWMHIHQAHFSKLLEYRLLNKQVNTYEDSHYLHLKYLNQGDKQHLKQIFKDIHKLQKFTAWRVQGVMMHER